MGRLDGKVALLTGAGQGVGPGYCGEAENDIGAVAVFLASAGSRYETGQTINADGGQVML